MTPTSFTPDGKRLLFFEQRPNRVALLHRRDRRKRGPFAGRNSGQGCFAKSRLGRPGLRSRPTAGG